MVIKFALHGGHTALNSVYVASEDQPLSSRCENLSAEITISQEGWENFRWVQVMQYAILDASGGT